MNHVMIDIETLGVRPTSIFLSVAAVIFDLDKPVIGDKFYSAVTLESAQLAGLTFDASTIKWWMTQQGDVRKKMFEGGYPLQEVLKNLSGFLYDNSPSQEPFKLWGNSASFDLGILGNAYDVLCLPRPWNFRDERCYRTIVSMFPTLGKTVTHKNPHDPVADCEYQIARLQNIWSLIKPAQNARPDYRFDKPETNI